MHDKNRMSHRFLLMVLFLGGCATAPPDEAPLSEQETAFGRLVKHSVDDYRRHYGGDSMRNLLPPLALAGMLANSNADRWIRNTWQDDVRGDFSNNVGRVFLHAGDFAQNRWSLPIYSATMLAAGYTGHDERDGSVATWAERSLRANVLGGPQAWAFTYLLGSHRPDVGTSDWQPWNDNDGVSGHAFYGAVPFLTAARMTESPGWRYSLYAVSMLPAWARVNKDKHYTSQVVMGWSIAWLTTRTIAQTPDEDGDITLLPLLTPDGGYVVLTWRF